MDGANPAAGRRAGRLTVASDGVVRVPVPSAVPGALGGFGAPFGFALDLGALKNASGGAGTLRVSFSAASNPPGASVAVAAGAWDLNDAPTPETSQSWTGGIFGESCALGASYSTCTASIDLSALPATPSGSVGLVLEVSGGGPAHVYLDEVAARMGGV